MTRTFIQTDEFSRRWDELGLDDEDLRRLELEILNNPKAGVVIPGTGKLRKMRFALQGRGKSGSSKSSWRRMSAIMKSVYDSIMTGLSEAVEDAKSSKKLLPRRVVTILPVKQYTPEQIKEIRNKTRFSQRAFAGYLGVSPKTVEAWEAGTNHPNGSASRLLNMMEMDDELIVQFPFVKV